MCHFSMLSPRILKAMNARRMRKIILARIKALARNLPGYTVRSTFIAGLPGETEDDFQMLLDFLVRSAARQSRLFCLFCGLMVQKPMNCQTSARGIETRTPKPFMRCKRRISAAKLHGKIGSMQTVLVDEYCHRY